MQARRVRALERLRLAADLEPGHALLGGELLQVEHVAVVHLHAPDAAGEELGPARPQRPRQPVRIVDGAEEEERAEVERVLTADDRLRALFLVDRQPERALDAVDAQVMRQAVVERSSRTRVEPEPVDALAEVDDDERHAVVQFDGEKVSKARLAAVVDDETVWLDRLEGELDGAAQERVPQRQAEVGLLAGERDGARLARRLRVGAARHRRDVAVDVDVVRRRLDERQVDEVDVARQGVAGNYHLNAFLTGMFQTIFLPKVIIKKYGTMINL